MTPLEKTGIGSAGLVIASDLLWLGIPTKIVALGVAGPLQYMSAALWTAGIVLVVWPYAFALTKGAAWIMSVFAGFAAYAIALLGFSQFETPIFTPQSYGDLGRIVGTVLMTWSMAGAFSLLLTIREQHLAKNCALCVPRESLPTWLARAIGPN